MKRQGTCQNCNIELNVNLSSRIFIGDEVASLQINQDFWPLKTLIEFKSETGTSRFLLERSK